MELKISNPRINLPSGRIIRIEGFKKSDQDCFGGKNDCVNYTVFFIPPKKRTVWHSEYSVYPTGQTVCAPKLRCI